MSYSRDSLNDLLFNSSTGEYENANKPERLYGWNNISAATGRLLGWNSILPITLNDKNYNVVYTKEDDEYKLYNRNGTELGYLTSVNSVQLNVSKYICWVWDSYSGQTYSDHYGYTYLLTENKIPEIGDTVYIYNYTTLITTAYIEDLSITAENQIYILLDISVEGQHDQIYYRRYSTCDINDFSEVPFSNYVCSCLTGDTLVTMYDRSTKRLNEVDVGDKVLSIDPDTGKYVEDEVIFTDKDQVKTHTCYDLWIFSDGFSVKTVHRHRFYNIEDNSFTYMDRWNIGDHTISQDGKLLELLSHETIEEEVKHYKITTKNYHNYFANSMLTGSRLTKNFDYRNLNLGDM